MAQPKKPFLPSVLNLDYGTTKGAVYSIVPTNPLAASQQHVHANIRNRNAGFSYEPHDECASFAKDRILTRDAAFHQTKGRMNIKKLIRQADWAQLYADDLFHILYLFVGEVYGCNLEIYNFIEALFFSLETMATIGYSTEDIFFDDCVGLGLILTTQICVKIICDALVIGVIYCRVSRPNKRASTIVFSNTAIIKRIRGKLYLQFRVCELRKHQLVEAHIRCYTIRHERDVHTGTVTPFRSMSMRLNHPNDELGGMLLMCLPQEVVHEIDAWSPILPPPTWGSSAGVYHWDPPALSHAKLKKKRNSSGRKGFEMSSYDTDLWYNYPDVMRRSASENPYSEFRTTHPHRQSQINKEGEHLKKMNEMRRKQRGMEHFIKHSSHDESVQMRDGTFTPPRALHKSQGKFSQTSATKRHDNDILDNCPTADMLKTALANAANLDASPGVDYYSEESSASSNMGRKNDLSTLNQSKETSHPYLTSYSDETGDERNFTKFHYEEHWEIEEREMIRKFMIDRNVEIIALVEGQDATSGGSVQARHSYKIEDIVWNASFVQCVTEDVEDGHAAVIDYTMFHETISDFPTPTSSFAENSHPFQGGDDL